MLRRRYDKHLSTYTKHSLQNARLLLPSAKCSKPVAGSIDFIGYLRTHDVARFEIFIRILIKGITVFFPVVPNQNQPQHRKTRSNSPLHPGLPSMSGTKTYPCWLFSLFQEWFRCRKPPRPSVMRENPAWRAMTQKGKDVCAHLASEISCLISISVPKNNRSSEVKKKRRRFKFWRKSQSDEINGETKATRKGSKLQWRLWKKKTESTAEQQAEAPNVTAGKNQKKKAAKQKTQQPRKWWKFWKNNRVDVDVPADISHFWAIHTKPPWYKEPVIFEPPKTAPVELSPRGCN